MIRSFTLFGAAVVAALGLAACSGQWTGSTIPSSNPMAPAGGDALFAPAGTDAAAKTNVYVALSAASISAGSKSVVVTLTKEGSKSVKPPLKTTTNFTGKGAVKCTTAKGCTVPGPAATAGTDTFAISVYDNANGKGNVLATATLTGKVKSSKTTLKAALKKNVKSVAIASLSGTAGTAIASSLVALTVKDADGNVVSGTYNNPFTVTLAGGTAGATSIAGGSGSATSQVFSSSSQTLKLSYTGLAIPPGVTLTPSGTGITGTPGTFSVTLLPIVALITPTPATANEIDLYATAGTGSFATLTLTQPGWKDANFNNAFAYALGTSGNCSGTVAPVASSYTLSPASGAASAYTVAASATVNAGAGPNAGACTLTVTGGAGLTLPVVLTYETTSIGINGKRKPH